MTSHIPNDVITHSDDGIHISTIERPPHWWSTDIQSELTSHADKVCFLAECGIDDNYASEDFFERGGKIRTDDRLNFLFMTQKN